MTATLASIDDIESRARSQLGYVESGGPGGHSGNIVVYWPSDGWAQYQGGSWCAAFVTWLFLPWADQAWIRFLNVVPGEALFKAKGTLSTDPRGIKKGAVLFYHFPGEAAGPNHTGWAVSDAQPDGTVMAIEGNTSSDDHGSQSNGGGVYLKKRALSLVHAWGMPNYASPVMPPPVPEFKIKGALGFVDAPGAAGGWAYASDGGVFTVGGAGFFGSMGGKPLNKPVVGMAATPTGHGYWLVGADGGIFAFGDAPFYGGMGGKPLNQPIAGMARTASGHGYWLVAADGGVFAYGDAQFYGSPTGVALAQPVCGIEPTADGAGYWLLAKDGGVFAYGDATSSGSMAGHPMAAPVVALVGTPSGKGYAIVGADGGLFNFGDAAWKPYLPLQVEYKAGERTVVGADSTSVGGGLEMVSNRLETYVV